MVKKIFLLLLSVLLALALIEACFWFFPSLRYEYGLNSFGLQQRAKKTYVDPINSHYQKHGWYRCRPSSIPGLGYEIVPFSPSGRGANSRGMIGPEYRLEKGPDTYRILVLGDSIMQEHSFVEALEEILNNAGLRYDFEIWNAGVGGYQVNQYASYLRYKGIKYHPDMVLVNFDLNDFYTQTIVYYETRDGVVGYFNPGRGVSKKIPLNKGLFRHSYLYRFLIVTYEGFLSRHQEGIDNEKEGRYYVSMIKEICQKRDILLFAAIFPYLKPFSEYNRSEKNDYRQIIDSLEDLNIDYIDLHAYIAGEARPSLKNKKDDYVHPSPEGARIAAGEVFRYLMENYFGS